MSDEQLNQEYDSTKDTLLHIKRVSELLMTVSQILLTRAKEHDVSKLDEPEKPLFDKYTPLLATLTFGSEEYKKSLELLKPALDHHYAVNSHHPQFYKEGVSGMSLLDVLEMFVDWIAASERMKDGDIFKSISINQDRFGISDQLTQIFYNTVHILKPSK